MSVFRRREREPDPETRQRALKRLAEISAGSGGAAEEERKVMVGGWVPDSLVPDRLRGGRWTLSPRHVAVVAAVLVVGLGWAGCSLFRARPEPVPARPPVSIASGSPVSGVSGSPVNGVSESPVAGATAGPGQTSASPNQVVVHVAGKVRRPGLIRAPAGSRVADVLALAGGAIPGVDLTSLNLARQVADGEQIVVGLPAAAQTSAAATPGAGGEPLTKVDLNTATAQQLEALPGVGPVLAQRIIDWRAEHGRFTSVDELQEVSGVGAKKFESIRPHVHV